MIIIRPITEADFTALQAIAVASGPGFTSLPEDDGKLLAKIERSCASFAANETHTAPDHPLYLFVAEDTSTGQCVGISAIEANVGDYPPLYHFHKSRHLHYSPSLNMQRELEILSLCNEYAEVSEVCSLYVLPEYRKSHAGRLLSKVRFLFMADFPHCFSHRVIAEMRGYEDESGQSPFWRWIQKQFLPTEFATIDRLVGLGQRGFIAEMMPRYPLYLNMIDPDAAAVIGRVHTQTEPALAMLKREGFENRGYFDLFDGGPTVEARLSDITTVRSSQVFTALIRAIPTEGFSSTQPTEAADGRVRGERARGILTNSRLSAFKSVMSDQFWVDSLNETLIVAPEIADLLVLAPNQSVRFIPC